MLEAPGSSAPFSLEPILVEMDGGRYIDPILPVSLFDLVSGRRSAGGGAPKIGGGRSDDSGGSGCGNNKYLPKVDATGGPARVRVRYDAHLPSLLLWDGENSRSILEGVVLSTLHGHVLCKNWRLCRECWEDCKNKKSHVPNPRRWQQPPRGYLKWLGGDDRGACSLATAGRLPPSHFK